MSDICADCGPSGFAVLHFKHAQPRVTWGTCSSLRMMGWGLVFFFLLDWFLETLIEMNWTHLLLNGAWHTMWFAGFLLRCEGLYLSLQLIPTTWDLPYEQWNEKSSEIRIRLNNHCRAWSGNEVIHKHLVWITFCWGREFELNLLQYLLNAKLLLEFSE